jgi:hypothetical protein
MHVSGLRDHNQAKCYPMPGQAQKGGRGIAPIDSPIRTQTSVSSKVSVHLMITIQKVTCYVQSVPCQSPDTS